MSAEDFQTIRIVLVALVAFLAGVLIAFVCCEGLYHAQLKRLRDKQSAFGAELAALRRYHGS